MDQIGIISLVLSIISILLSIMLFIFGLALSALLYPKNRELIYRAILRLYPRSFRQEHGAEMLHTMLQTSKQRVRDYGELGGFFLITQDIANTIFASFGVRTELVKQFTFAKMEDIKRDAEIYRSSEPSFEILSYLKALFKKIRKSMQRDREEVLTLYYEMRECESKLSRTSFGIKRLFLELQLNEIRLRFYSGYSGLDEDDELFVQRAIEAKSQKKSVN